ncbi:Long-chain-fatty-acid--CoA ligase [Labilithrix luteola]|uniref:Long-chain-fatty-acid--CoA ligase n=1 Tax=Labilithrix luteola TaxID=1391654 RepID=A0A0K1PZ87_9BACT|nr:long-chain fatty acid--CoA ligase [Labilithrix luteola]AKU98802.1 Long-chain-fatty-acid--CoA ligase [Labilithrix luteola]
MATAQNTAKPWLGVYSPWVPETLPAPTKSMIDVLEEAARTAPDAPALYYFDRVVSYRELDDLAARFATLLASWNVGHGDRVALYQQNVPQYVIALYGIWKRGAVAVPLNPMFKDKELEYHLQDSGARVLVALESLYEAVGRSVVPRTSVERVVTTSELDMLGTEPAPPCFAPSHKLSAEDLGSVDLLTALSQTKPDPKARAAVGPGDLASLGYTSGTTGQPKGAMTTHGNIVYNGNVYRTWMKMDANDVILGVAPLFHITGLVGHVALAATAGCPLVLGYRFDAEQTIRLAQRWKPTMTVGSITVFLALMNHPAATKEAFASLRKAYSGGAPVAPSIAERFEAQLGVYIHNIYGLTESTSPTHAVPLGARAPVDPVTGALSVGVPIPGCDVKLVDLADPDKEAAPGEAGELADKGPMIFTGYWNKPDATKQAFRDGYFVTGDVATRNDDGYYFVVDRKKDMIIVSGYKVWPREVEDTLYGHAAVREAAVIGVKDDYRGETVKAFVALKPGTTATEQELIDFCRSKIAAYKYPRSVEIVDEVPKTATGKFLRRALRDRTPANPNEAAARKA